MRSSTSSMVGSGTSSGYTGRLLGLGEGVVVLEHQRLEVAELHLLHHHPTGLLAVFQAHQAVGDHHVVVHVLAGGLGMGNGVLVGLHVGGHLIDGGHVEAEHAEAVAGGLLIGGGVARRHPHGRVGVAIGLGQHVEGAPGARLGRLEGGAVGMGVGGAAPDLLELPDHLVPVGLGLRRVDAETADLVASRPSAGAELEPALAHVVEHGHPLGQLDGVVHDGVQVEDARSHVDLGGLGKGMGHEHLAGRGVGVVLQEVVLAHPDVLPVVLVGDPHHLQFVLKCLMLPVGAAGPASARRSLQENGELHGVPPCIPLVTAVGRLLAWSWTGSARCAHAPKSSTTRPITWRDSKALMASGSSSNG